MTAIVVPFAPRHDVERIRRARATLYALLDQLPDAEHPDDFWYDAFAEAAGIIAGHSASVAIEWDA